MHDLYVPIYVELVVVIQVHKAVPLHLRWIVSSPYYLEESLGTRLLGGVQCGHSLCTL